MNYHIGRDGQQLGEFSEDVIRAGLREGRFLPTDLAWAEGMSGWQALGSLPQFQMAQSPFPPQPTGGQPVYGGQPSYGGPPVTPVNVLPPAGAPSGNGLAVTSLVCGILCCCGVTSIVAVVCGHIALARMNRYPGPQNSRGMAIAGLILGYIGLAMWIYDLVMFGANPDKFTKQFNDMMEQIKQQQQQPRSTGP